MNYIRLFILASFIGWVYEYLLTKERPHSTDLESILQYKNVPLLTIYGTCTLMVMIIYDYLECNVCFKILISAMMVTVAECIIGKISYKINRRKMWCYPNSYIACCDGFISVKATFIWTICISVLYVVCDMYRGGVAGRCRK